MKVLRIIIAILGISVMFVVFTQIPGLITKGTLDFTAFTLAVGILGAFLGVALYVWLCFKILFWAKILKP